MNLRFTKMHGLGNDFIVIDGVNQTLRLHPQEIEALARRDTGVGFDQCLLVEASDTPEVDFRYRIFNANGQEVGQCGNGARCLALFLRHYGLTDKRIIKVSTYSSNMQLEIHEDNTVSVNMGMPRFSPEEIPLKNSKQQESYELSLPNQETVIFHSLSVGNPHAIIKVAEVDTAPVQELGSLLSVHPLFPEETNVEFMEIISPSHLRLRVYERGCGETRACGSGAVAAAIAGRKYYGMNDTMTVSLPGGDLQIQWEGAGHAAILRGAAAFIYEGVLMSCTS